MIEANLKHKLILHMLISVYFAQQKSAAMYYDTQSRYGIFCASVYQDKRCVITVPRQTHILYSRSPWVNYQCLGSTYSLWMTAVCITGKIGLSTDKYWCEQIQELCLQFLQSIHHNSKELDLPTSTEWKKADTNVAASETYKGKFSALQSLLKWTKMSPQKLLNDKAMFCLISQVNCY
jgi:hypothetical protein